MPAPEPGAQSRSRKALRPDPQPDTLATLAQGRAKQERRRDAAAVPVAGLPAPAGPQPTQSEPNLRPVPPRAQRVDLQFARRVDLFAPQPDEEVRPATTPGGQAAVEIATAIRYVSGREEGTVLFQVALFPGEQVTRLGPWEQMVYFALCELFCRYGTDADGWLRISSMRTLAWTVLGREPRGQDYDRIEAALLRLAQVTILKGSECFEMQQTTPKGKRHVIRTTSKGAYGLISDVDITTKHTGRIGKGESRTQRAREVRVHLSATVMERLRGGLVATLNAQALREIGPGNETTLRLYAWICSQRGFHGHISAMVVEQIVRPTAQWGLQRKPAKFRSQVKHMVERMAAADPRLTVRFVPGSREAGGWLLAWERTHPRARRGRGYGARA
jgi:hypothetical protein